MATQPLNVKKWSVGTTEVAKYAPKSGSANRDTLKVHIPKIIPLVEFGTPKQVLKSVSATCFINAKACKPSVAKSLKIQNYITVPRNTNQSFTNGTFTHGDKIMVEVRNKNVDNLHITNSIDSSS